MKKSRFSLYAVVHKADCLELQRNQLISGNKTRNAAVLLKKALSRERVGEGIRRRCFL